MNSARHIFAKWNPIDAHYVDPETVRLSSFVQSSATRKGHVPPFKLHDVSQREGSTKPRIKVTVPAPLSNSEPGDPGEELK
jgi:hypothetical protein